MHKNSDFMAEKKSDLGNSSTEGTADEIKMKLSRLKAKLKDSKRKKPITTPKSTPKKITVKKKEAKKQAEAKKKEDKKKAEEEEQAKKKAEEEALKKTIETKEVHYWSRSRKKLWHKGQISGFVQKVKEIRIDDDQDSVWLSVDIGIGSSCHVGYRSCFYRSIPLGKIKNEEELEMEFKEKKKIFDPKKVYKDEPNPTKL